jgi:hypothetical protein
MEIIVRHLHKAWRGCVMDDTQGVFDFSDWSGREQEVLVYKDHDSWLKWDELGACEATLHTMVHVLQEDKSVTVVVDDPEYPETKQLLQEIREAQRTNWWFGTVKPG